MAAIAACLMWAGVSQSGSPPAKLTTSTPCAFRALAFAVMASVDDGATAVILGASETTMGSYSPWSWSFLGRSFLNSLRRPVMNPPGFFGSLVGVGSGFGAAAGFADFDALAALPGFTSSGLRPTSPSIAIGAPSPCRMPAWMMRVQPPWRLAKRGAISVNSVLTISGSCSQASRRRRAASVPRLACVISFSAARWASLALGRVVWIRSYRNRAWASDRTSAARSLRERPNRRDRTACRMLFLVFQERLVEPHAQREPHRSQEHGDLRQRLFSEIPVLEHFGVALLDQVADRLDFGLAQAVGAAHRQLQLADRHPQFLDELRRQRPLLRRLLHGQFPEAREHLEVLLENVGRVQQGVFRADRAVGPHFQDQAVVVGHLPQDRKSVV